MQAFFIFALFGLVATTILGIVSGAALSGMQMIDRQVADTERYFKDVAYLVNEHMVMKYVQVPEPGFGENMADNFAELESLRRGANWAWGPLTKDPWQNDLFIFTSNEAHPIAADGAGISVAPDATGFILASPGPDREFDAALQADLDALDETSTINDVMRIEARDGTDDIVHTFNTRRALERRWEMVEWHVNQVAETLLTQYQQSFADEDFQDGLKAYYQQAMADGAFYDPATGQLDLSGNLDAWKAPDAAIVAAAGAEAEKITNARPDLGFLGGTTGDAQVEEALSAERKEKIYARLAELQEAKDKIYREYGRIVQDFPEHIQAQYEAILREFNHLHAMLDAQNPIVSKENPITGLGKNGSLAFLMDGSDQQGAGGAVIADSTQGKFELEVTPFSSIGGGAVDRITIRLNRPLDKNSADWGWMGSDAFGNKTVFSYEITIGDEG